MMKFIDMFSGIGGFRTAMENNGHECIAYSEIDKYAKQSYQAMYDTENEIDLGDITNISQEYLSRFKEENDIVVGGSPCFRKGTLITTKNGLKPIEEIKKGDYVLTHNNRYKEVVVPMVNPAKEIYSLKVEEVIETFVTPEHPIRVKESRESEPKWIKVKDLDKEKHFVQLGNFEYSTIEEVKLLSTDETVYNFEVEDDNSYVANNMVVHNCQSFSLAGSRKGFEDTRGTLFFEYAKVVKETQPKYFLFENVKGMMSHDKGNTIRVVLETFNELGYCIDFNVFNSKYYGVPQNRERIYIIGKRKDLVEQPKYHDKTKGKKKFDEIHNWAVDNINYVELLPPLQTEVTTRLIDVLEDEVDEKYYLSDEKVKKLTLDFSLTSQDKHGVAIREATKQGYAVAEQGDSVNVSYPTSKTRRGRVGKQVAQTLQAGEVNQGVVIDDTQGYDGVRCYKGIAPTLRSSRSGLKTVVMDNALNFYAKDNVVYDEEQYKELVKTNNDFEVDYIYVEPTLYQLDEKHILLINNDQNQFEVIEIREGYYLTLKVASSLDELNLTTYKKEFGRFGRQAVETLNDNKDVINDGMTVNAYNKTLDDSGLSPTLTTRPEGFKTAILPITNGLRIRKLTPLECWRLQGFKDEQFYKAKDSGVSNSQLYKQSGNAITISVADAIIKKITEGITD